MRTTELIRLMPTQYKRVSENPLYVGHHMPYLGYWSEDDGYVKNQELEYDGEVLACPIVAVVETKIGDKDLLLTVTGKVAKYESTRSTVSGDYTLNRKIYEDAGTTLSTTLTIPRYTRPWGTFLITGLGKNIWSISTITLDETISEEVGKVSFYALASAGSKIIYWFGIHMLAEELRDILRPWMAPPKCSRCSGTGIEPETDTTDCKQCFGYKYSGYSAVEYSQRRIGFDLGLAREVLDWDALTEDDHVEIKKFINKCWTQKWWVTPTVKEIKRLFAHFYGRETEAIRITERFNSQEPVWSLGLPFYGTSASPFGSDVFTQSDQELMKYIAESVTPAGVSVFVGFYRDIFVGDMDDFSDALYKQPHEFSKTSLDHEYELWGQPRWDFWNGWTEATFVFEDASGISGFDTSGDVSIVNVNDMNRNMVRLVDNAYMQTGIADISGSIECWVHPEESEFRFGMRNASDWMFYVEFDENGFYDCNGFLLTMVTPFNDYHLSIDFNTSGELFDVRVMQDTVATGIAYLNSGPVSTCRIENYFSGDCFFDALGLTEDLSYSLGDNWQRLYEQGWGINNDYYLTGTTGDSIDVRDYNRKGRFWDLNNY